MYGVLLGKAQLLLGTVCNKLAASDCTQLTAPAQTTAQALDLFADVQLVVNLGLRQEVRPCRQLPDVATTPLES